MDDNAKKRLILSFITAFLLFYLYLHARRAGFAVPDHTYAIVGIVTLVVALLLGKSLQETGRTVYNWISREVIERDRVFGWVMCVMAAVLAIVVLSYHVKKQADLEFSEVIVEPHVARGLEEISENERGNYARRMQHYSSRVIRFNVSANTQERRQITVMLFVQDQATAVAVPRSASIRLCALGAAESAPPDSYAEVTLPRSFFRLNGVGPKILDSNIRHAEFATRIFSRPGMRYWAYLAASWTDPNGKQHSVYSKWFPLEFPP
ncbi:MAG: hypothetical protein DWQ31_12085 [Planctomycetota bacterium]|nr:MAG: hypothetical protein DWQ31_12085 [Planctomycetota bacterium]REJ87990.1 MAG: hypothetical protein DWQ35_20545 [Planctomycetota bacterium]REK24811.1 MAG: hypothetical protein DWQ42_12795 [Planctomycetota bacterium]REK49429.1 MAG: hypothetical protein DWQ46_00345 [Planctomycetota bacterium]